MTCEIIPNDNGSTRIKSNQRTCERVKKVEEHEITGSTELRSEALGGTSHLIPENTANDRLTQGCKEEREQQLNEDKQT